MSAISSKIAPSGVANAMGTLAQLLRACRDAVVGHFMHRVAIAALRQLDDRALQDIGLRRPQIEAAVHSLVARSEWEQVS
jgi:uncharacterized protein YjiS (DUF1127 family)